MANQYTKSEYGRLWDGRLDTKFSVMLKAEQADQLDALSAIFGKSKSDIIRGLLPYLEKRAIYLRDKYPNVVLPTVPVEALLNPASEEWFARIEAATKKSQAERETLTGNAGNAVGDGT